MGWIIAAGIIALFVLLAFLRVFVNVRYNGELGLYLKILFLKIRLFPAKNKAAKKNSGKKKKPKKDKKDKKEAKEAAESKKPEKKKKTVRDIIDIIKEVSGIAKKLMSMFFGYLSVRVRKLYIVLDAGDPSKTALGYAGVTAAVNSLFALLDENVDVRYGKEKYINVVPEYTMNGSSADIDISFGFRIWQLVKLGINALFAYLKIKSRTEESHK